jgi:hypothetical protein
MQCVTAFESGHDSTVCVALSDVDSAFYDPSIVRLAKFKPGVLILTVAIRARGDKQHLWLEGFEI